MLSDDVFSLHDRTILVTGGTRGIGRAISLRLAEAGASVIALFVRNQDAADSLRSIGRERDLNIEILRADLTRPKGLEAIEAYLIENDLKLSGFIHSAATGVHKRAEEFTPRDVRWVFSLNIEAFMELVARLLPHLEEGASIVALSSKGASRAVPFYGLVGASKGALEAYSRQLAAELGPRSIRVNVLSAGAVKTDAWDVLPDRDQRLSAIVDRTPLGRLVTPEEVACAAQFLCSGAASGVTGHTMVVDGGAGVLE